MIYIISPFSDDDKEVQKERFEKVRDFTARLMNDGLVVFSPVVYGYEFYRNSLCEGKFENWQKFNYEMIDRADSFIVLMLDGWDKSTGIQKELEYIEKYRKPELITYIKE